MDADSLKRLLSSVLDGLDRLYDGDLALFDLESLLYAAALAIHGHRLQGMMMAACTELSRILRAGIDADDAIGDALEATSQLRIELARILSEN